MLSTIQTHDYNEGVLVWELRVNLNLIDEV